MVSDVLGFLGPLVLGVIVTMGVEAVTGKALALVLRQRFQRRSRRRLEALGDRAHLIRRGPECLYTIEFVPGGWLPDNVRVSDRPARPLGTVLAGADRRHLPADAADIVGKIEAERLRLADPEEGWWNGPLLGVDVLQTTREGDQERPVLCMTLSPTDFASAQVCSELWRERFDAGQIELPADLDRPIPGMLHAVGLNATLVTDDRQLILVRRSLRATSSRTGLHISVNEGMQDRDRDAQQRLDPYRGIARGLHEELGIEVDPTLIRLHTAMLDVRRYQFGLLGHVDLAGTGITAADIVLARRHGLAQDKFENSELVCVPWRLDDVAAVLAQESWVAHGWLNLVHSAISDLGPRASRLYSLLEGTPTGVRARG